MNRRIIKNTLFLLGMLLLMPNFALAQKKGERDSFEPARISLGKFRGLRAGSLIMSWSLGSRIGLSKVADSAVSIASDLDYHLSSHFAFNFGLALGFGRETLMNYGKEVGYLTFNVEGFFGVKLTFNAKGPFIPYLLGGLQVGYFSNGATTLKSFTFGGRVGGGATYFFKRNFGVGLKVLLFPCGYYGKALGATGTGLYFPMDILAVAFYKFR